MWLSVTLIDHVTLSFLLSGNWSVYFGKFHGWRTNKDSSYGISLYHISSIQVISYCIVPNCIIWHRYPIIYCTLSYGIVCIGSYPVYIVLFHIGISYPFNSVCIIAVWFIWCCIVAYCIVYYHFLSYIVSYIVLYCIYYIQYRIYCILLYLYCIISYLLYRIWYRILWCIVSYPFISHIVSYCLISHHILPFIIMLYHLLSIAWDLIVMDNNVSSTSSLIWARFLIFDIDIFEPESVIEHY